MVNLFLLASGRQRGVDEATGDSTWSAPDPSNVSSTRHVALMWDTFKPFLRSGARLAAGREHEIPLEPQAAVRPVGLELARKTVAHPRSLAGVEIREEIAERAARAPG